ncbi:hypothetical protein DSO57_1007720 [Entomophthora muscae]|uniref:Uncharacterized protein n=1 Tax=Entomophthora muscae TaxID=34485 RepID=A0ACC2SX20_9FUNG|nr:hypothetical protein DSO57_1007720 [Entomophthora muscae]
MNAKELIWLQDTTERDLLYGSQSLSEATHAPWSCVNFGMDKVDYLAKFEIHIPTCNGKLAPIAVERKCIEYAYDWFMYMTTHEVERVVFEAAVLVIAGLTIMEEKAGAAMGCSIFGISLELLLKDIGHALHPRACARLRTLVIQSVESQGSRQDTNMDHHLKTLEGISSCYLNYMRWRNIDGYYEVAMLCSFATMGESCAELTVGVANDILEAAILTHDTHSVLRHFEEDEMANCHRFLHPNLQVSISRAFERVAGLRNNIRFDCSIPASIKRCAMVAISACHSFNYACRRYRYGADFANVANFVNSAPTFTCPFSNLPKASVPFSKLTQKLP